MGYFGANIIKSNVSISAMLFWRFFVSTIVILAILLFKTNRVKCNMTAMSRVLIYGAIFYGSSTITYFMASQSIGTGIAMVIFYTYPAIVMFCGWLFGKEKISKFYYISIVLILLGMILLIDKNQLQFDLYGIMLSLFSALGYAIYIMTSKSQTSDLNPLVSSLMVSLGNSILFLILSILNQSLIIPSNASTWFDILSMSIICTALPILFFLEGLKHISATLASILSVFEPITVVIVGVIFLQEEFNFFQFLGVFFVLIGALIVQFERKEIILTSNLTT